MTVRPLLAFASAACLATSCASLEPPESLVDLDTSFGVVHGISTEYGILALSELVDGREDVPFRYHVGNGLFDDRATVSERGPWLSLLQPISSRPNEARLAGFPAEEGDELYLEDRDPEEGPRLIPVTLVDGGASGNLIIPDEGAASDWASRLAGAPLLAHRDGYLQVVGVLNGVYTDAPRALAYIGLDEIAYLVPAPSDTLARRAQPRRSDFEYGIPRDFAGERPHASGDGAVPDRTNDSFLAPTNATPPPIDLDSLLRDLDLGPPGTTDDG